MEMIERQSGSEPEVVAALTPEETAEVNRLQHGIAVLDLSSKEENQEVHRAEFIQKTYRGTESRQEILQGSSYKGDESKLENAITKMVNRYSIRFTRRKAMLEHAAFLGIPAVMKGKRVVTNDPSKQRLLEEEHGKWRMSFSSRHRTNERAMYRGFLESKVQSIVAKAPQTERAVETVENGVSTVVLGPAVNLEERAVRLTRAINAMARRSMLSGFGVAVADEQYNEPIYERYDDGTTHIDRAVRYKVERLFEVSKRDFWVASGFPEIRKSGTMSEYLLKRRSTKMWNEFKGQFEHAPQQPLRVKVRKQLAGLIPSERLLETKIK